MYSDEDDQIHLGQRAMDWVDWLVAIFGGWFTVSVALVWLVGRRNS